jgi:hypothetical protein
MLERVTIVERDKRNPFAPDFFDLLHQPTRCRLASVYGRDAAERAARELSEVDMNDPYLEAWVTTNLVRAGLWSVGPVKDRIWADRSIFEELTD